jgi:hypothetical protein
MNYYAYAIIPGFTWINYHIDDDALIDQLLAPLEEKDKRSIPHQKPTVCEPIWGGGGGWQARHNRGEVKRHLSTSVLHSVENGRQISAGKLS